MQRISGRLDDWIGLAGCNTNCVYFVRTMTSPERKLGITDGRVSQANPGPVFAHRARRDAQFVLAICMSPSAPSGRDHSSAARATGSAALPPSGRGR